jgi:hypothetical protein
MAKQLELPSYTATASKDFPGFLIAWCPRVDCPSQKREVKRPFVVHADTWLKPDRLTKTDGTAFVVVGRACPYCFRSNRLPKRSEIR